MKWQEKLQSHCYCGSISRSVWVNHPYDRKLRAIVCIIGSLLWRKSRRGGIGFDGSGERRFGAYRLEVRYRLHLRGVLLFSHPAPLREQSQILILLLILPCPLQPLFKVLFDSLRFSFFLPSRLIKQGEHTWDGSNSGKESPPSTTVWLGGIHHRLEPQVTVDVLLPWAKLSTYR